MALMPHELLDQCGGRDFVLISADAILQEHVLEKFADMEYHGGQFLHMAFLVEKFVLEMQKRNINYHVVFFDSEKYGMIYSNWYKKEIELPEIDEITQQNKTTNEYELRSKWIPNTLTYQFMKLVLKWHLERIGIQTRSFSNWLDDEKWNRFLRDSRPSFIHGTNNTYLPMYYNLSKYDLKITRDFKFEGNLINGFGSEIIDSKRIDKLVVKKIQDAILSHLEKSNITINQKGPFSTQLVPPIPDSSLVTKVNTLIANHSILGTDENKIGLIVLSLLNLLKNFDEKNPQYLNFSKSFIFQLSQLLVASSLLQLTLPLRFRAFTLNEESEHTSKRLTQFLHLVYANLITILENNVLPFPLMQDIIDGRLFHKLCILHFKNGKYNNSQIEISLPSKVSKEFESIFALLKEVSGSVSGGNENEWKDNIVLVEAKVENISRDERLAPISNDLVIECFGDILNKFETMSVNQLKEITNYDENIEGLYDWKSAQKIEKSIDPYLNEKKKKGREEAQQRLFQYSQALQEGHILEQRVITVTEKDDKSNPKKKNKAEKKTGVSILQRKNDLVKLKADAEKAKYEPKSFTISNHRKNVRKCYEVWREVITLPTDSAYNDIVSILNSVWELLNFFMQEILKQIVDQIKSTPTKTNYDKWSIFHKVSFVHELAMAFLKTGETFDAEYKQKFSKKKGGKIIYRGPIIEETFYKQFKDQLVIALERSGFYLQAQLLSGKGGATKKNELSPWVLELMYHNADDPVSGFVPPKKIELGENMLDLGFTPDDWQQDLIRYVEANSSVLVSAPTSSGKTFIAFYAIEKVLRESNEGVVVFVCPTKALVNQVYSEVLAKYTKAYVGTENKHMVGMSTGDQKIYETSCQVLVTTPGSLESLMLDPTTTEWKQNLRYVILDEIHTINEQGGNNVWEHLLLMLTCPFLALSASLGNPQTFVNWLSNTSKYASGSEVKLVEYKERPCPLEYSVYVPNFKDKEPYVPTYAIESVRPGEVDTTKIQSIKDYLGEDNIPPKEISSDKEESGESDESDESSEDDEEKSEDGNGGEDGNEGEDESKKSISLEEVSTSIGSLSEIHPASVLNHEQIIVDEIKNMFLMSPHQCLRLYQAAEKHADAHKKNNLFAGLEPDSLAKDQVNFGLLKMTSFNNYRKKIHSKLLELAENEENHSDLLAIFAILREDIDRGFNQIYENVDVTQYNSEDYLFDNIIGLVKRLRDDKKLPAIIFNLGHHFIDQLMELLSDYFQNKKFNLWETEEDRRKNQTLIRSSCETLTGVDKKYLQALQNGIAVHYNSLSPDYQMEAERLFRMRVVPIIIATSTLALGINMPCKTVVIAGKSVYLSTTYFNQMSGRAGRRGFDSKGSVVLYGIPRASINRFMTSPNPHILSSTGISPSFILRLLELYSAQTTKEHKEIVKKEILRIIKTPVFDDISNVSQEQVQHQILYHLDFLAKSGLIDEKGEPRDFSNLVSKVSTHEPNNFLISSFVSSGIFHRLLQSEREIISKKRKEQAEILATLKKEQLNERVIQQKARKRTGILLKKQDRAVRSKQINFEKEIRELLSQKNLDEIVQIISYLFAQPRPGNLHVGDMDNTQFFKGQSIFFDIQEESYENEEKLRKIAECNILDEMNEIFVDRANHFIKSVMETYTNYVVSFSRFFKHKIPDNILPLSKYTAYDPIAEKLKESAATVVVEQDSVKQVETKEEKEDDLQWDEGSDDDLQWDENAEDEDEVEEVKVVETEVEATKDENEEISVVFEGIEKELSSLAVQGESISSFAALSGYGDNYKTVDELIYKVKHTIPLDSKEIPCSNIFEYPQNAFLYDFYKRGSFDYLQNHNLVNNLNETRTDINNVARDMRSIKFSLQEIAKPNSQRDDLLFLALDRISQEFRDKISEQRQKHRYKIKTQGAVEKTDEEKFSKKSSKKDKSWGDKHAPDAVVERVRKESGREKGMKTLE